MARINNSRKKSGFSLITLFTIIFAVFSISFGTIIYSASSKSAEPEQVNEQTIEAETGKFIVRPERAVIADDEATVPEAIFTVNDGGDTKDATPGNAVCADAAGKCTLRAAIEEANAAAGIDEIKFEFNVPTEIQLNAGLSPAGLIITQPLKITGSGARNLTVKGNSATTAGILKINSGVVGVNISGITIANSGGHGINNEGELTLADIAVKGNGTGINSAGKLVVTRATISGNSKSGLVIAASADVNISNTTVSGNQSATNGGGINSLSANVVLNNVTITGNSATEKGGGIYYDNASTGFSVRNTIIAGNTAASNPDVHAVNGKFTTRGNNLIGKNVGSTGFENSNSNDKVGTNGSPIDPLLKPLRNNGGQTDTHALLADSPALNSGNNCVVEVSCRLGNATAGLVNDQRGADYPRVFQDTVEIGAFESFYPAPTITSISPENSVAGGEPFELTINGTKFVADSVVKWNGQSRQTTFVSNTQLKIQVTAADIATKGEYAITVTNPEPGGGTSLAVSFIVPDCAYSINPSQQSVAASGGVITVNVTAQNGCRWTAVSNVPWLIVGGSGNGNGNGTVSITVAANPGVVRPGAVTIAGQTFTVDQAAGCSFSIAPSVYTAPAAGGAGSFTLTASDAGCGWSATSSAPWITVIDGSGRGSKTINFTVAAHTSTPRSGEIKVGNQTFTVNQVSGCNAALNPTSANVTAAGVSGSFNILLGEGCGWAVSSTDTWISITTAVSGTGNGLVNFTVAANQGPARSGKIKVNDKEFSINQESGCAFTVATTPINIGSGVYNGSVAVGTSDPGCVWSAQTNDSWITVAGNSENRTGSGTVQFSVAANNGPPREGAISVAGKTIRIFQADGCTINIAPLTQNFTAAGGTGSFAVTASNSGCRWTASSNSSWVTITSGTEGEGNGSVSFTVAQNIGLERNAEIIVGGKKFDIRQSNGCTFSLPVTAKDVAAAGETFTFALNASASGCSWTAQSDVPWIAVNPTSGTSGATISLVVAANTGPSRTGKINVGGQIFTVTQASGCTFSLSFTSTIFDAAQGVGSFEIRTNNSGCTWTATASETWITFDGASTGTGTGTISYIIQANINPERSGYITVGGQRFDITQRNGCVYSLPNTIASIPAGGGASTFTINSGGRCPWTAVSNDNWITITGGASGTGSGIVSYTVAPNPGPAREGTITAGGRTFNVKQDSGCSFTIVPAELNVPASGGTIPVTITASDQRCTWTARSDNDWITISGVASGTGNGTIQVVVAANISPERSGSITVAGRTIPVRQGNGCVYSLSPTSASVNENGGNRNFNVNTGAGCTWTATSNSNWISITGNASGSGNGTVQISIGTNTGDERTGTVTVAGQIFTVYQVNLIVSNTNDSGRGSLRQAVINANNTPGDDIVTFNGAIGLISLTSGEIEIVNNGSLEIRGPGSQLLIISGGNSSRIFHSNKANVTIKDLTLANGNGVGKDSAVFAPKGGAIYAYQGSLTVDGLQIVSNRLGSGDIGMGGGIFFDNVTNSFVKNSTFYNNRASNAGGVYTQYSVLTVSNSTFADNVVTRAGGGIYSVGTTTLKNVTISGNVSTSATPEGAGISVWGGSLFLGNSIVAGNIGPEITFNTGEVSSLGNNLVGDSLGDSSDTKNAVTFVSNDLLNIPPKLAPLSRYGGLTPTMALMPGSPAINAGNSANVGSFDQRGSLRVVGGSVDIGAFEYNISMQPELSNLPNGTLGTYYSQAMSSARLDNLPLPGPFIYKLLDESALPPGLSLTTGGLLQGVPTTPGVYNFHVVASLPTEMAAVNKYTISVDCTFALSQTNFSYGRSGGTGALTMTSSAGCNWTPSTNANWITITSALNGSGNGSIAFTVAPNLEGARTGTITAGGQTITINQAAGCAYSLTATTANMQSAGGTGNFGVTTESGCPWTASTSADWITITSGTPGSGNGTVNFTAAINNSSARTGTITAAGRTFTVSQEAFVVQNTKRDFDFDGDGKADIGLFRPQDGVWHLQNSTSGYASKQWGESTDKIVPADYDGDKKTDHAVFRGGYWHIIKSSDGQYSGMQFGEATDIPLPGDFDGDGKADIAVFRPSSGTWYIMGSRSGFVYQQWGAATDRPVAADFDGDGKADMVVYRPSNGTWYLLRSRDGFYSQQWGEATDKMVVGDYDGDGRADISVWRPSNGNWYILQSRNGFTSSQFGMAGDLPTAADYDGDGKTDLGVYRNGSWYVFGSATGFASSTFGTATDKPIANSFVP